MKQKAAENASFWLDLYIELLKTKHLPGLILLFFFILLFWRDRDADTRVSSQVKVKHLEPPAAEVSSVFII